MSNGDQMLAYRVKVTRLPGCVDMPAYQTPGAAGMDIYAARPVNHTTPDERRPWEVHRASGSHEVTFSDAGVTVWPGDRVRIPAGFAVAVPAGFELVIRPRSGMAWRDGITVANSPGTIDSDYRGPVAVVLVNHGSKPVQLRPGMRIAQAVLSPVTRARFDEVDTLPSTSRGAGGFGSTGDH